jgi:hypothetical protein
MFWWTGSVVLRLPAFRRHRLSAVMLLARRSRQRRSRPRSHAIRLWESSRGFTLDTGFERHKGYPTAGHIHALGRLGPLPLHRRSFAPVWMAGGVQQQLGLWGDRGEGEGRLGY